MKSLKLFGVGFWTLIIFSANLYADETCTKIVTVGKKYTESTFTQDLASYSTAQDNQEYKICFVQDNPIYISKSVIVNAVESKPFTIDGLKLEAKSGASVNTFLILNGIGLKFTNSTLTGPGTGTAIKIDAKDVTIDTAAISKFATAIETTANSENVSVKNSMLSGADIGIKFGGGANNIIGPSNSFTDFATGVYIAKDVSAYVTQGKFTNVATPIAHEIPAFAGMTIITDWLGKHISEADANKIDRIAGKLDLTECKGNVGMYVRKVAEQGETDQGDLKPLEYQDICPVAELKDKPLKLTFADKSEKEIAVGSCYFDCDKLQNIPAYYRVSFLYSSATNQTAEFMPLPTIKISELGDVISVMGPLTIPIATSGADSGAIIVADSSGDGVSTGETSGTVSEASGGTITVADYTGTESSETETSGSGNSSTDTGGSNSNSGSGDSAPKATTSGDGYTASQGSGGCGGSSMMGSMRSETLQGSTIDGILKGASTFLLSLLGLVPIVRKRVISHSKGFL